MCHHVQLIFFYLWRWFPPYCQGWSQTPELNWERPRERVKAQQEDVSLGQGHRQTSNPDLIIPLPVLRVNHAVMGGALSQTGSQKSLEGQLHVKKDQLLKLCGKGQSSRSKRFWNGQIPGQGHEASTTNSSFRNEDEAGIELGEAQTDVSGSSFYRSVGLLGNYPPRRTEVLNPAGGRHTEGISSPDSPRVSEWEQISTETQDGGEGRGWARRHRSDFEHPHLVDEKTKPQRLEFMPKGTKLVSDSACIGTWMTDCRPVSFNHHCVSLKHLPCPLLNHGADHGSLSSSPPQRSLTTPHCYILSLPTAQEGGLQTLPFFLFTLASPELKVKGLLRNGILLQPQVKERYQELCNLSYGNYACETARGGTNQPGHCAWAGEESLEGPLESDPAQPALRESRPASCWTGASGRTYLSPQRHIRPFFQEGLLWGFRQPKMWRLEVGTDWTRLGGGELLYPRVGAGSSRQAPKSWPHLKADISSQVAFLALAQGETLQARGAPTVPGAVGVAGLNGQFLPLSGRKSECMYICELPCFPWKSSGSQDISQLALWHFPCECIKGDPEYQTQSVSFSSALSF
ncbi:hypothetical protein AAY473_025132 [Plecturocebus cupreus]